MIRSLVLLLALAAPAAAHTPEGADPSTARWFQSLRSNNHAACCGEQDCRVVMPPDVKIEAGTYWVRDRDLSWLKVFPEQVLKRGDNPTGVYVACVSERVVLCFVVIAGA